MSSIDVPERLAELTAFLSEHAYVWRPRPFHAYPPGWIDHHPELAAWARALPRADVDRLERDAWDLPEIPDPAPRWIEQARLLSVVPPLTRTAVPALAAREWGLRIRGRKWRQVRALVEVLRDRLPAQATLVDWCCGKGHLGRTLARVSGRALVGVERDGELCDEGARLAAEADVEARFVRRDVLRDPPSDELGLDRFVVALHACGGLNLELLRSVARARPAGLALAPCCHHRIEGERYEPLSEVAAPLELSRGDCQLACTEHAHARDRAIADRHRGLVFRLALDRLCVAADGRTASSRSVFTSGRKMPHDFPAFVAWAREHFDLPAVDGSDCDELLARTDADVTERRALALVRWIFRRPMELWHLLDRARFLADHGYEVEVGTFCDYAATPRNLLLLARRTD